MTLCRWSKRSIMIAAVVIETALLIFLFFNLPEAHADVGNAGPGPSPGLCDYPAVCGSGVDGAVIAGYYYWEDFPTELNGSHRHCQWGGGQTQGAVGISMILSAGVTGPVGGINGECFYVCPDMQQAQTPNPPGGWKDAIVPTKCQPIGRNPFLPPPPPQDVPISPPIAEQGAIPQVPFQPGAPVQPPPPPPYPERAPNEGGPAPTQPIAEQLPSVTNPGCAASNPDATNCREH